MTGVAPQRAQMGQAVEHDIDWRRAVQHVVWIPEAYRSADMPAGAARRSLRCSERSFAQLVELGLPSTPGADGPLFDPVDIKNVGLYSGSGVTEMEQGIRLMLSFMQATKDDLMQPRRWRYRLQLVSSAPPGARTYKLVYRPTPEIFGGALESATSDGRPVEAQGPKFRVAQGSGVEGTLVTRGVERTLRSSTMRQVIDDFLGSGIRWHALPPAFAADPAAATALGVGNCATLCAALCDLLRGAGFEAIAYHGWMTAVSEVDHGWIDVGDEDGEIKALDPAFALLATGNGYGSPGFRELTMGSTLNRVIPTQAPLDAPYVHGPDEVAFLARPAVKPKSHPRLGNRIWRMGS